MDDKEFVKYSFLIVTLAAIVGLLNFGGGSASLEEVTGNVARNGYCDTAGTTRACNGGLECYRPASWGTRSPGVGVCVTARGAATPSRRNVANNQQCSSNNECASGNCQSVGGGYKACKPAPASRVQQRRSSGSGSGASRAPAKKANRQSCARNSDCQSNFCKDMGRWKICTNRPSGTQKQKKVVQANRISQASIPKFNGRMFTGLNNPFPYKKGAVFEGGSVDHPLILATTRSRTQVYKKFTCPGGVFERYYTHDVCKFKGGKKDQDKFTAWIKAELPKAVLATSIEVDINNWKPPLRGYTTAAMVFYKAGNKWEYGKFCYFGNHKIKETCKVNVPKNKQNSIKEILVARKHMGKKEKQWPVIFISDIRATYYE